ncbi:MAG: RsmE family RNA methyltransferase, partial [Alistipes sp.]|nr:RsmE family RNA methyltransferase [Alistipes sp.]
ALQNHPGVTTHSEGEEPNRRVVIMLAGQQPQGEKAERSEKVITAAMKQSLKAYRPELQPLTAFRTLVATPFEGRKFIAHCDEPLTPQGKRYLASTLQRGEAALILIGPEGDFSPEEIRLAAEAGFEEITLGTMRLRTETAAVVAVTMVSVVNNQ